MARMNRSVQKPKDMKRALGKLISYCRKEFAFMILVVKNGDIIEQGNHEKLLKKNGFYAELYNSQFEQSA